MIDLDNQILDISELNTFASQFCLKLKKGDIIFFKGELGVGKTTFARVIIRNLHTLNNLTIPKSIGSPTYPILLIYNLTSYEIYHYDLYRIKNKDELAELDIFENIYNSITLIEWPELLIEKKIKHKHYIINLEFQSETKRNINIKYL